jgi:hypothetical protein
MQIILIIPRSNQFKMFYFWLHIARLRKIYFLRTRCQSCIASTSPLSTSPSPERTLLSLQGHSTVVARYHPNCRQNMTSDRCLAVRSNIRDV